MLSLAIAAAKQFAPSLIGSLFGDKAESVAKDVVGIAQNITGESSPKTAMEALANSPELVLQFKEATMDYQLKIAQEETSRLQTINATMVAESKSEHWPQYSWRPFNGFLFGITLFCNYGITAIVNTWASTPSVAQTIPEIVFIVWGSILGVTAWTRGNEKAAKAGVVKPPSKLDRLSRLINTTVRK